jgi:hypothetical protein
VKSSDGKSDLRYLKIILNPKRNAPKIMNDSFRRTFGKVSAMRGMRSSLVNARILVSQNDVPAGRLFE